MSYMLAHEDRPPFVLSPDNASAYFDPSTVVKETKARSLRMLVQFPRLRARFVELLKRNPNERHLSRAGEEGDTPLSALLEVRDSERSS